MQEAVRCLALAPKLNLGCLAPGTSGSSDLEIFRLILPCLSTIRSRLVGARASRLHKRPFSFFIIAVSFFPPFFCLRVPFITQPLLASSATNFVARTRFFQSQSFCLQTEDVFWGHGIVLSSTRMHTACSSACHSAATRRVRIRLAPFRLFVL